MFKLSRRELHISLQYNYMKCHYIKFIRFINVLVHLLSSASALFATYFKCVVYCFIFQSLLSLYVSFVEFYFILL